MATARRSGWFTIAAEHKRGWYTGEGAVEIQTDGAEATKTVMPTIPWTFLTGVTRVDGLIPDKKRDGTVRPKGWGGGCSTDGMGTFAAGVWLPGGIGCCGISYRLADDKTELRARKAYFAFGNLLVLAGNGVTATGSDGQCITSLLTVPAQDDTSSFMLDGELLANADMTRELAPGAVFAYRNIGFVATGDTALRFVCQTRKGRFIDINALAKDDTEYVRRHVILYADHGVSPSDAHYEGVIVLGAEPSQVASTTGAMPVERVATDDAVIAFRTRTGSAAQAVFFDPGETNVGSLNSPGAMAWRLGDGEVDIAFCSYDDGDVDLGLPFEIAEATCLTEDAPPIEASGRTLRFSAKKETVYQFKARLTGSFGRAEPLTKG
jgi:hypothetical protein